MTNFNNQSEECLSAMNDIIYHGLTTSVPSGHSNPPHSGYVSLLALSHAVIMLVSLDINTNTCTTFQHPQLYFVFEAKCSNLREILLKHVKTILQTSAMTSAFNLKHHCAELCRAATVAWLTLTVGRLERD